MKQKCNLTQMEWINKPERSLITDSYVVIETKPKTDFWGKTYYNRTYENAPALVMSLSQNFSFGCRIECNYAGSGDQSGILVIADEDNWFKIAAQYHDEEKMYLCVVVNQHGYSDYSSVLIAADIKELHFRIDHLNEEFKVEYSYNGKHFRMMRFFHLKNRTGMFKVGIYAASPLNTSFDAVFTDITIGDCLWDEYKGEIV